MILFSCISSDFATTIYMMLLKEAQVDSGLLLLWTRIPNTFCYVIFNLFLLLLFSGAAAASRLYVDAITKLARQAQQGTWGGSADIGKLMACYVCT